MKKGGLLDWLKKEVFNLDKPLDWIDEDEKIYKQIVALIENQPTITKRDIENCAGAIQYSVQTHEDWGYVEDILKDMLTEIGVTIIKSGK